jgi:hypothetical protein
MPKRIKPDQDTHALALSAKKLVKTRGYSVRAACECVGISLPTYLRHTLDRKKHIELEKRVIEKLHGAAHSAKSITLDDVKLDTPEVVLERIFGLADKELGKEALISRAIKLVEESKAKSVSELQKLDSTGFKKHYEPLGAHSKKVVIRLCGMGGIRKNSDYLHFMNLNTWTLFGIRFTGKKKFESAGGATLKRKNPQLFREVVTECSRWWLMHLGADGNTYASAAEMLVANILFNNADW